MKYARFEDLPVWNLAIELAEGVYALTRDRFFSQSGDLHDQLRRAVLSISNNVAEGFERGSTAELLSFLYIARGSAGEVRSMLRFVERLLDSTEARLSAAARDSRSGGHPSQGASRSGGHLSQGTSRSGGHLSQDGFHSDGHPSPDERSLSEISNLRSQISHLREKAESCSRQIRAWADSLQNSEIKGQRHLTDQVRAQYESKRRATAFLRELDEMVRKGREQRDAGIQDPNAGIQDPNAGIQGPGAGIRSPNAGIQGPSAGIRSPNAAIRDPDEKSEDRDAGPGT